MLFFIKNVTYTNLISDPTNALTIREFGVTLDTEVVAGTSATVTIQLWFNYTIYQCQLSAPSNRGHTYSCDVTQHPEYIVGTSYCDDATPRIMIQNHHSDGVLFSSVYFTTINNITYGIESFCIPQSISYGAYYSNLEIADTECGSSTEYKHYDALCIDSDVPTTNSGSCYPPKQMLYFDTSKPDQYINAATWSPADDIECPPTSSPTTNPTSAPTKLPSSTPTINPSLEPTTSSQPPTLNPTNNPTLTPQLIRTNLYGGTGGVYEEFYNQGRISGITSWGLSQHWSQELTITQWIANGAIVNNNLGADTIAQTCQSFNLSADNDIIGYTIYYDTNNYVNGLVFHAFSGQNYSCIHSHGVHKKTELFRLNDGRYYYLSGFAVRYGAIIDAMAFEFKLITTQSPTANPTREPSGNPTTEPTTSPTAHHILVKANAAFSTTDYLSNYTFSPPYNGTITGIKLEHRFGTVTCNPNYPLVIWGCQGSNGPWFGVQMILHKTNMNQVYYPTLTTEGVTYFNNWTCSNGNGCDVHSYGMNNYDLNDDFIKLNDDQNPYNVSTSDTFSIQYSEGCCGSSISDNSGTAYADVYFLYETYKVTKDPTTSPTISPTMSYVSILLYIFRFCYSLNV